MPVEVNIDDAVDPWDVFEPIFNHIRSGSNRVYSMIFNSIRSSAMVNYEHRETTTIEVDDGYAAAVVVNAQDVANLISCLEVLRLSTHEIDRKKRSIVEAIRAKSRPDD